MIKKIKIKKDPQRLKHSVRFDIEFFLDPKEKEVKKLLIVFVQKGGIADKKFLIGDVIKSVNGVTVTNRIELDNEVNKVDWGDEVTFDVERKNKIQEVVGGRKDYKTDCLAAEFKDWEISWSKNSE